MKFKKKKLIFFLVVMAIFALERAAKLFFSEGCLGLVCIEHSINRGAAFGLFSSFPLIRPILVVIALAVLLLTAFFYFKSRKLGLLEAGLMLLFAGTLSNLYDRITLGYVIDFLTFSFPFPAFNFADLANLAGAALLIIYLKRK